MIHAEVDGGSQRLSGFDFETMFITSWVLFGIFVCLLVRKALCMQFGTVTWTLAVFFVDFSMAFQHGCSIALQFAVGFLNQFWTWSRQRRRRGRRPHDVHVRCLEVRGTIHLLSAIWCVVMLFVRKVLCMQFWYLDLDY